MNIKILSFHLMIVFFAGMAFLFPAHADTASDTQKDAVKALNGEYVQNYETVLKELCTLIDMISTPDPNAMPEEEPYIEGAMGILEKIKYPNPNDPPAEPFQKIGYTIRDINADGIAELIIGEISEKIENSWFGSKIYAVYKLMDGKIYCLLEGTVRNSFELLSDGTFFNFGSEGAAHAIFGSYALYPKKAALECEDFYFNYEKDETFQEILYYHNTSGIYDKAVSDVIAENEYEKALNEYYKNSKQIQLFPLSSAVSNTMHAPSVSVQRAERIFDLGTPYHEFTADNSKQQVKIAFSASINVKDFKVLKLECLNVDENGKPIFSAKEIYMQPALKPHHPFVLGMTFLGSIPQYGISYIDENGRTKQYTINQNSKDDGSKGDGSIYLQEF